jgi:glyceraldehyde 3-phosphate dehydrogenase
LPIDEIDRLVVYGVNEDSIEFDDRAISAGSSTMNALALLLKSLIPLGIRSVNMTTIHSYTSDQSLQDVVGSDFRCSRSASENIIPNESEAEKWISQLFPSLENKINCNALNVPVQKGSMLDLSMAFNSDAINVEEVNSAIIESSKLNPDIIGITNDPVVSSDIIGDPRSLVFDIKGTLKAGENLIKVLGWYDNGHCHAMRILDVVENYSKLGGSK